MNRTYRVWKTRAGQALRRSGFFLPCLLVVLVGLAVRPGQAQSVGGVSQDLLQSVQQRLGNGDGQQLDTGLTDNAPVSNVQLPDFSADQRVPLPPSRLENILSARAGTRLRQFGYDQLGRARAVAVAQTGAVQDDYVLGSGDQVSVTLRGQENSQLRATVDRDGQVVLPRLNPIAAAGRTFGSFRDELQAAVKRAYVATDAFASISRVRQVTVLVSGEVNNPGQRYLNGLSSVVDALLLSGGVKKTGSLRNVQLIRGGRTQRIDLYAVLTGSGAGATARLADGDRIVVPPLGRTVAVTGLVRLPGIFELPGGQSGISARALLALAGGQEVRGRYRLAILQIDAEGQTKLSPLLGETALVRDSEILFVQLGADQKSNSATLSGGSGLAGSYPITPGTKLAEMLRAPGAVGDNPYTLFGIIVRRDPRTLMQQLVAFTPVEVLSGAEDIPLRADDLVRPFSVREVTLLNAVVRAYLEKLAGDQAQLRNPLMDQTAAGAAGTPQLGTQQPGAAQPSAAPAGIGAVPSPGQPANAWPPVGSNPAVVQSPGSLPATVPTLPLSKSDELSFAVSDLSSVPPDVQRADIIALMNLRAPGTLAPGSQEALLENRDQTGQLPSAEQRNQAFLTGSGGLAPGAGGAINGGEGYRAIPGAAPDYQSGNSMPSDTPSESAGNYESSPLVSGRYVPNREVQTFGELVRQLNVDPLVLINFLIDQRARLDGAVRGPGAYFVGPQVQLSDLVQAAGGTVNWADESGVELITTAVDRVTGRAITQRQTLALAQGHLGNYIVRPRDTLRFNPVFTDVGVGSVTVQGEVRSPGSYPILRGEHLSQLLARAGGLTGTAYPYGTVFLRKSAAVAEHEGYIRTASEVQNSLVIAMTRVGNDKIDPNTFASMQAFVTELRNQRAVGRISIVADPSVLAANPNLDPLLEAGDLVYIPQRSSTVSVLGQVAQPGSFPYQPGLSVQDYIEKAGGYSAVSDSSMTFVVLPDGSARKVEKSWLSFTTDTLPPGSTIVVPRDVTPLDTRQLILDISSIFSQFAVSIASVAVLAKQ